MALPERRLVPQPLIVRHGAAAASAARAVLRRAISEAAQEELHAAHESRAARLERCAHRARLRVREMLVLSYVELCRRARKAPEFDLTTPPPTHRAESRYRSDGQRGRLHVPHRLSLLFERRFGLGPGMVADAPPFRLRLVRGRSSST